MTFFSSMFNFFRNVSKYLDFEAPNTDFLPNSIEKRREQQPFSCSIFSQAKDITNTFIYGFFGTCQVTKLIWFKFSSACSRLVAFTFKNISKNAVFAVILQNFWENLHFH